MRCSTEGQPAVPQGEAVFYQGDAELGRAPLDAGAASLTLPGMAQGTAEIVAYFAGSATWAPCESAPLTLFVGVEPPAPGPTPTTIFLPLIRR
jgi:Bacterial Ig-like domain (group 3)